MAPVVACGCGQDAAGGSGDPGRLVGARVEKDRTPVVTAPDRADLAALQTVDIDAVPVDVAPGGGDAQKGAFLRATHDDAHHDLVALAEDVLDGRVRVGQGGHHAGEQPGDVRAASDRAYGAAVPLHVSGEELAGLVAVVLVDDFAEERPHLSLVGRHAGAPRGVDCPDAVAGGPGCRTRHAGGGQAQACGHGEGRSQGGALELLHDRLPGRCALDSYLMLRFYLDMT